MRLREHRGSLDDSMATMVTIASTIEALTAQINTVLAPYVFVAQPEQVQVKEFSSHRDERIGWEKTFVVTVDGYGVFGFCDEPVGPHVIWFGVGTTGCPFCEERSPKGFNTSQRRVWQVEHIRDKHNRT
jgi:hypothetical protein